jgi:hypothetical protein
MTEELHPAENRGYRELYAAVRQVESRWGRLAGAYEGTGGADALRKGSDVARELLGELKEQTAARGLHGTPAAQGTGAGLAQVRSQVTDRFLERNQALRFAVLDLEHVVILLGYLAELAVTRDDEELAKFCQAWAHRLRLSTSAVRKAAFALAGQPDDAIEPLDESLIGRTAHRAGALVGTVGEWLDSQAARMPGLGRGSDSD